MNPKQEWSSEPVSEVAEIKQAYQDATALLVRLANVLEAGFFIPQEKMERRPSVWPAGY